ncbi:hypothetical protein [Chitinophaga sp. sic0106]|uniref:hypothetical protein n=1 Tax=Chitinophaga sp. sic0106 TaxID=2854785 RepID=UPI001C44678B|nr:hypothetical protein [Chitinophaga sp. sic0106]MBV7530432.1 hypothetical protein [Chitinophaga sp. sic0106]
MPALNQMYNVHKAKLICELLPEEIPGFLDFAKSFSDGITAAPDELRKQWKINPIIGPDHWLSYAAETSQIITQYGKKLAKSPKVFADQLFDGMIALYTCHCLQQYVEHKTTNEKFKLAYQLIF